MTAALLAFALSLGAFSLTDTLGRAAKVVVEQLTSPGAPEVTLPVDFGDGDDESDADDDGDKRAAGPIEIHVPNVDIRIPAPPRPPLPPGAPPAPGKGVKFKFALPPGGAKGGHFSVHAKDAPAVDVLHRIAAATGWTLVVSGLGDDPLTVDLTDVDPREAVRSVLKQAKAWGVLRGNELVVVPATDDGKRAGELVESRERGRLPANRRRDLVRLMHGDLVVPRGTVLQGNAVVVGGSLTVEPGALVQGDAVAILGSISVEPGGMVLGDAVAVLGRLDIDSGGQVLGEHVQVGLGRLFRSRGRGFFSRLGLFGFFPTLALFALIYLVGLFALLFSPDRLRGISATLLGSPLRSFLVGFLSWLLVVPLAVLLCVTLVGIPLLPLLPLVLFLSFALGLSAVALRIGELLPAGPGQKFVPTAALGMGVGVLALVAFLPLVGLPVLVLVQFAAVGAVVASRGGKPAAIAPA